MRLLLISMVLSFMLTNCPTEGDTDLVEMQASVNPEEAGEVNPPEGSYISGREITVTTAPVDSQWQFMGWSGDTTAQEDSLTFVITRNMELVANYEIPTDEEYIITSEVSPQEGGTVEPDSASYVVGTLVDIEALPNDGWEFVSWSGDTSATQNPLTFEITRNYNLVANFEEIPVETYTLTTNAQPDEGGEVDPAEGTFEEGTSLEVEAIASSGWQFTGWSGDTTVSETPLPVVMDKNYSFTANFEEEPPETFTLSTDASPIDGGTVNPAEGSYEEGTEVSVEAIANTGWRFVEWSGDTTITENPFTVVMDKNYNVTANFAELPTLTTSTQPTEGGTVEPESGTFEYNSTVDVEAIPADGWEFTSWSGDLSTTDNPLTLTMDRDYSLTANFNELPQAFSEQLTISDGVNSKTLTLGMHPDATAGFDSGIDVELPNVAPPDGAFYRRFVIPDYALREDFRAVQDQKTVWEMEFAPEEGQTITVSWDLSNSDHVGSMVLVDDPNSPSLQIDMKQTTSYEVTDQSVEKLYIISNPDFN